MQQTQIAVQPRKRNLQDTLLSKLRRSRMDGKQQMVYKHAISTVVPERPLSWEDDAD